MTSQDMEDDVSMIKIYNITVMQIKFLLFSIFPFHCDFKIIALSKSNNGNTYMITGTNEIDSTMTELTYADKCDDKMRSSIRNFLNPDPNDSTDIVGNLQLELTDIYVKDFVENPVPRPLCGHS